MINIKFFTKLKNLEINNDFYVILQKTKLLLTLIMLTLICLPVLAMEQQERTMLPQITNIKNHQNIIQVVNPGMQHALVNQVIYAKNNACYYKMTPQPIVYIPTPPTQTHQLKQVHNQNAGLYQYVPINGQPGLRLIQQQAPVIKQSPVTYQYQQVIPFQKPVAVNQMPYHPFEKPLLQKQLSIKQNKRYIKNDNEQTARKLFEDLSYLGVKWVESIYLKDTADTITANKIKENNSQKNSLIDNSLVVYDPDCNPFADIQQNITCDTQITIPDELAQQEIKQLIIQQKTPHSLCALNEKQNQAHKNTLLEKYKSLGISYESKEFFEQSNDMSNCFNCF